MPAKKPQVSQILTASELQSLKDEQKEVEQTLSALEGGDRTGVGTPADNIDREKLRKEAQRLGRAIESGMPKVIRGGDKDKLHAEAKALEAKIQEGMCSADEMARPEKHAGSIRKHYEWEKRNMANIQRWKQIQRQMEHADPTASNVERLRRT